MSDPNAKAVQGGPRGDADPTAPGTLTGGDHQTSPPPGPRGVAVDPDEAESTLGDERVRGRLPTEAPPGQPIEGQDPVRRRPGRRGDAPGGPQSPGEA